MPSKAPALGELSHKDFDEHYLRRFDHFMPMFSQPILERTPYSLDQFMLHFGNRLESGLKRSGECPLATRLRQKHLLLKHIAFKSLEECAFVHLEANSITEAMEFIRKELVRITNEKCLLMESSRHPLYDHYKAKYVRREDTSRSNGHQAMDRIIDVGHEEQHIARTLADVDLSALLQTHAPEFVARDPACRILEFCVLFRKKMRQVVCADTELTDSQRDSLLCEIIEEWTIVRSSQIGKTMDERENMHRMARHIEALRMQLGIGDIETDTPLTTIRKIVEGMRRDGAAFVQYLPLLEHLFLDFADKANDVGIMDLFPIIFQIFTQCGISICDQPGMQIAMLAVSTRYATKERLVHMIN